MDTKLHLLHIPVSYTHLEELDFNASIPSFNYNGQQLDDIRILAGRVNDSLTCTVDFKKQIGKAPVDFRLLARAAHDNVYTGLNWTNHAEKIYQGSISADTRFTRNEEKKMLTDIEFHPSQIIVNDSVWNVHASSVHAAPGLVNINGFAIEQGDRHLILNGNVSGNPGDSLTVDLKDINLEYIFNIINFHTCLLYTSNLSYSVIMAPKPAVSPLWVDVYKRQFFPQLVAGPIVKASDFIPQLYRKYCLSRLQFGMAVFWILNGLLKKIILSDYLAVNFIDRVFDNPMLFSGFENLMALFAYSLQVYADFSGYTDIAIGLSLLMGFRCV